MKKFESVWREPAEQTDGFDKLMVHDNMQSGSINVRNTRLPLWAFITTVVNEGWSHANDNYEVEKHYGYTKEDLAHFLYFLLEQRGEFGRLLLALANAESKSEDGWFTKKTHRKNIKRQLNNCIKVLEQLDNEVLSEQKEKEE